MRAAMNIFFCGWSASLASVDERAFGHRVGAVATQGGGGFCWVLCAEQRTGPLGADVRNARARVNVLRA